MKKYFLYAMTIFLLLIAVQGCRGKEENQPKDEPIETEPDKTAVSDTTDTSDVGDQQILKETVPDIIGTWKGTLDNHSSTLRITEQDSLTFKGRLSTNFREAIHQEVSGKINPENRTITMKDLLHSRYEGTYSAKLSEDFNSMSGTFTMSVDKSKLNFNYKKQ
jgi:hypothetical protein